MGAVDTTYTFTATDTITSSKMNNIIDQTKMTAEAIDGPSLEIVSPGKIRVKAQGISSNELAPNSVTEFKIKNDSVTTAKIANLNVTSAKIADNAVTGAKLANSSIVASNLNSGQTGTAPIIAARATIQMKRGIFLDSSGTYTSIPVTMSIDTSVSPRVVTVTSNTPHGYLAGEPFFIWINTTVGADSCTCGFVDEVISTNSFKFKTNSSEIPIGTAEIYFIDPTKYNSINIKRVHVYQPATNAQFIGSNVNGFFNFIQDNLLFNATFNTPLSNVDNACVIGSDGLSFTQAFLNYFDFISPLRGFVRQNNNDDVVVYDKSFSISVFA